MEKLTQVEAHAAFINLLRSKDYKNAGRFCWPWLVQNEWTDKVWNAIEKHRFLCIMGHGSASKTFTSAAWFLLDWWREADQTATIITSDTVSSMKRRIWSDFKMLYMQGRRRLKNLPGELMEGSNMIRLIPTDGKNAIHAIAAESDDAQSKIQGLHTKKVRVVFDEADNKYSKSIWSALANLGTSGDLKVVALANPNDRNSEFGQHCEPIGGWDSVTPETDFEWTSRMGWHVLRLDGLQSPNIKAKKDIFPFLLTNQGLEDIKNKYNDNSREWWKYVRAWFPPQGTQFNIFSAQIIQQAIEKKIIWYASTRSVAACDPAFEGGDVCVLVVGTTGRIVENPDRPALHVNTFYRIHRKDQNKPVTIDFADQVIELCKRHGVQPQDFGVDSTGTGIGFSDYIKHAWSKEIMAVSFAGSATEMHATAEDSTPAKDRYDRFVSELWFTTREWMRLGMIALSDIPRELQIQLTSRNYETLTQGRIKIEKKEDMKNRGLDSPDFADALCLLTHVVRVRSSGFLPGTIKDKNTKTGLMKELRKIESHFETNYGIED